jgi:ribosomal subunit interface protein
MEMTFTGRGVRVTDEIRSHAEHKLASLERIEPRLTTLDLEIIGEHHPKPDGMKRVEAALRTPRKTFRAHAEAGDVPTAIDGVKEKLERQLRDHHGRRRAAHRGGVGSASDAASRAASVGSDSEPPEERAPGPEGELDVAER